MPRLPDADSQVIRLNHPPKHVLTIVNPAQDANPPGHKHDITSSARYINQSHIIPIDSGV